MGVMSALNSITEQITRFKLVFIVRPLLLFLESSITHTTVKKINEAFKTHSPKK